MKTKDTISQLWKIQKWNEHLGRREDLWSYPNLKLFTHKDGPEFTQKTGKRPGSLKAPIKYPIHFYTDSSAYAAGFAITQFIAATEADTKAKDFGRSSDHLWHIPVHCYTKKVPNLQERSMFPCKVRDRVRLLVKNWKTCGAKLVRYKHVWYMRHIGRCSMSLSGRGPR